MRNSNKQTETMAINRKNAMALWEKHYENKEEAQDFSGLTMQKCAYDQRGSKYCWNIDHILPKSRGGTNDVDNLICTHISTNSAKADKFPSFVANDKTYEIRKIKGEFKIVEVTNYQEERVQAMQVWDSIYGDRVHEVQDYSGRKMIRSNFAKDDSETGWKTDKYIQDRENQETNIYIANIKTINERSNRPNFLANDISWSLRKVFGGQKYEFHNEDILDIYDAKKINKLIYDIEVDEEFWCNLLIIKADFQYCKTGFVKLVLQMTDELNMIHYSFETAKNRDEELFILRFRTQTKEEVEEIYNFAILLNTYSKLFQEIFEFDRIAIYNMLHQCDENDIYSRLDDLLTNKYSRNGLSKYLYPAIFDNEMGLFIDGNVRSNISTKDGLSSKPVLSQMQMYECNLEYTETKNAVNKLLKNN